MKPRILLVSAAEMDLIITCDQIPSAGASVLGNKYDYIPGGKGTNTSVALSKLGGDCVFCSCLGDDDNGAKLRRYYNECGIDTRFIAVDRTSKTGFSAVLCENNSNIRSISFVGASEKLTADHIEEAFTCYPDALYIQTVFPPRLAVSAVRFAYQQKIPVYFDIVDVGKEYPFEELEKISLLMINTQDAYRITGIMPTDMENCLKAAMALEIRVKAKYYVIRIFNRGIFIYDGRYYQIYPTYDGNYSDTFLASDAFKAALALNFHVTGDIKNACSFANVVGEMTAKRKESNVSLPDINAVKEYMSRLKLNIRI